ncbi:hypothetical protein [Arthrobacter pigmenti]
MPVTVGELSGRSAFKVGDMQVTARGPHNAVTVHLIVPIVNHDRIVRCAIRSINHGREHRATAIWTYDWCPRTVREVFDVRHLTGLPA